MGAQHRAHSLVMCWDIRTPWGALKTHHWAPPLGIPLKWSVWNVGLLLFKPSPGEYQLAEGRTERTGTWTALLPQGHSGWPPGIVTGHPEPRMQAWGNEGKPGLMRAAASPSISEPDWVQRGGWWGAMPLRSAGTVSLQCLWWDRGHSGWPSAGTKRFHVWSPSDWESCTNH